MPLNTWWFIYIVTDPDHFDTDPGPIFHFDIDPDPDPTFHFDTDPDPTMLYGSRSGSLLFQRGYVPKTVIFIHLNLSVGPPGANQQA
jgi:hypothetical protein